MLVIRLQRVGRKNDPNFRMVVVDSRRAPKSGAYLEVLGSYNPKTKKTELKNERIKHRIMQGAQISPTAHNILVNAKVIEASKINVVRAPKKVEVLTKPVEGV